MYDRGLKPIPEPPTTGLRYRAETLLGLTGVNMAKYRDSWYQAIASPLRIVWRPQLIGILFFEASGVCISVTTPIEATGHDVWLWDWRQCELARSLPEVC